MCILFPMGLAAGIRACTDTGRRIDIQIHTHMHIHAYTHIHLHTYTFAHTSMYTDLHWPYIMSPGFVGIGVDVDVRMGSHMRLCVFVFVYLCPNHISTIGDGLFAFL